MIIQLKDSFLRTYILSLIAIEFVNDKKSILSFFEKTFWAHQYKDLGEIERIVNKMLGLLESWEFITGYGIKQDDFTSANEIGDQKIKATKIGKRVAELYLDPYTARFFLDCIK